MSYRYLTSMECTKIFTSLTIIDQVSLKLIDRFNWSHGQNIPGYRDLLINEGAVCERQCLYQKLR